MDNTLKETEWITINKVLLEMYDIHNAELFTNRVLRIFRMLIPYSKGYFIVLDRTGTIQREYSSFLEMDEKTYLKYVNIYYDKDYLKYVFDISNHTVTYRDTDIMEESIRKKTEFYREFLKPNNIPYGAGILLRRKGEDIGIVNFFRNSMLGDFSNKDMFILDVLKEHLAHMLYALLAQEKKGESSRNSSLDKAVIRYGLSDREREVISCIMEGMSNAEISDRMSISISTVKKHVYHIFTKMKVNTRTQLRAAMDKAELL